MQPELFIAPLFLFIFGSMFGSFLNVAALRYGTKKSIAVDRSACSACGKPLRWHELVPILSFIMQKARCSGCRQEVSWQYPTIEFVSGLLLVLLAMPVITQGGSIMVSALEYIIAALLIILFLIDLRTFLLPDFYVILLSVFVVLLRSVSLGHINNPESMFWGVLAGSGFLLSLWLITKGRGIGFGDVKLMVPLGLLFGLPGAIVVLFLAFFTGGILGSYLLYSGRATPKTAVPFGPFLAGSAIVLLVYPDIIGNITHYLFGGLL